MQFHDAFFDGSGRDQLDAGHRPGLADAVGAVRRLGLGGGIPPGVEMDDRVGPGQVEAGAARLQGHQHDGDGRGRIEGIADALAVLGGAVEVAIGDVAVLEGFLEELERRDEGREHQHAVAGVLGFFDEFEEGLELRRIGFGQLRVEDARVGADLAEAEQLIEGRHLDAGLRGAAHLHLEDLLARGFEDLVVDLLLVVLEVAVDDLLDLGGQFGGDGDLGATEDVRRGHLQETVVVPLTFVGLDALLGLGQIARHQEAEERAEVFEGVLDGRAGEDVAALRDELLDRLGGLRARVLDVLAFVADRRAPRHGGEGRDVAGKGAVGGDDEVEPLQVIGRGEAVLAVVGEDLQGRGEAAGFAAPVLDERSRADHDAGAVVRAVLAQGLHEGERLHGLAEAHFVGEQAAERMIMDMPEPGHADLLVDAEHLAQVLADRGGLELREVADRGRALAPGLGRGEGGLQFLGDGVGAREVGEADLQVEVQVHVALGLAGDAALGVADRLHQLRRDEARAAVGVEEHAPAGKRFLDDLRGLAFGVDADGEAEAVVLLGRVALRLGEVDVAQGVREVMREERVIVRHQQLMMAGEEVEHLDGAGEVPLAGGGLEREAAALQDIAEFGDGAGRLLGQADAQPLHRAVDPRTVVAAAFLGADFLLLGAVVRRLAGGVGLRGRDGLVEMLVDLVEMVAVPGERGLRRVGHAEDLQAFADGEELAQVAAGERQDALQLAVAEVLEDRQEEDRVGLDGPGLAAVEVLRGDLGAVDAQFEAADDLVAHGGGRDVRRHDETHLDGRAAFFRKGEGFEPGSCRGRLRLL